MEGYFNKGVMLHKMPESVSLQRPLTKCPAPALVLDELGLGQY